MKRLRPLAVSLSLMILLVAIAGFVGLPILAKREIPQRISAKLHRATSLESISFNPFTLRLEVHGLSIAGSRVGEPLLAFDALVVNFSIASIARRAAVIDQIELRAPRIAIERRPDGRLDISDIMDSLDAAKPATGAATELSADLPRLLIQDVRIHAGSVHLHDQRVGIAHSVSGIELRLPRVSTLPEDSHQPIAPDLTARIDGATVHARASLPPVQTDAPGQIELDLADFEPGRYAAYLPGRWQARLASGRVSAQLKAIVTHGKNELLADLAGTIAIESLDLRTREGEPLVAWPRLAIDIAHASWPLQTVDLTRIAIDQPEVNLRRGRKGEINLARIARFDGPTGDETRPVAKSASASGKAAGTDRDESTQATTGAIAFRLDALQIRGARLQIDDEVPARGFHLGIAPLDIDLKDFTWPARDKAATLHLALQSSTQARTRAAPLAAVSDRGATSADGGKPAVASDDTRVQIRTVVSLGPEPTASGRLEVSALHPADFLPYYEAQASLRPGKEADVALATDFDLRWTARGLLGSFQHTSLQARRLNMVRRDGSKGPLEIAQFDIDGAGIDLDRHTIELGRVASRGAQLRAVRSHEGTIESGTGPPASASASAAAKTTTDRKDDRATPQWRWHIDRLNLDDYALHLHDEVPDTPVDVHLAPLTLALEDLGNAPGNKGRARLKTGVNAGADIAITGTLGLMPLAGAFDWTIDHLGIADFSAYLSQASRLAVSSGTLSGTGSLALRNRATAEATSTLSARVRGALRVEDFICVEAASGTELLRWQTLALAGIEAEQTPPRLAIGDITLSDFSAGLVLGANGRLNLQSLEQAPAAPASTVAPEAPTPSLIPGATTNAAQAQGAAASALDFIIGRIRLERGNIKYTDLFIRPNFRANLTDVSGSISTISRTEAGDVDLRARLDDAAPVQIIGKVNPMARPLLLDLRANARDIQLPTITAYAERYLGYGIEKGSLSADLEYHIAQGRLTANNRLRLDQLTFGDRVEGPDALNLPVRLAMALLRDRHGVIDIDLPISGSLDDPQFSVGRLVLQVLVNLITKVVTAPFSLLASVFSSDGERFDRIDFAAGSANIDETATTRLRSLAHALTERPSLRVDVTGHVEPDADASALAAQATQAAQAASRRGRPQASLADPAAATAARSATGGAASQEDLRALASARANVARAWLTGPGGIDPDRIFLVPPRMADPEGERHATGPRVDFALR